MEYVPARPRAFESTLAGRVVPESIDDGVPDRGEARNH